MVRTFYQTMIEPLAVAHATGRLGSFSRTYRGKPWTAYVQAGQPVQVMREGDVVDWADCPKGIRLMAVEAAEFFTTAYGMKREAS